MSKFKNLSGFQFSEWEGNILKSFWGIDAKIQEFICDSPFEEIFEIKVENLKQFEQSTPKFEKLFVVHEKMLKMEGEYLEKIILGNWRQCSKNYLGFNLWKNF